MGAVSRTRGPAPDHQREAPPLPHAVDLLEPGGPHPPELDVDRRQHVLEIPSRLADGDGERRVQLGGRRFDHLEVRERPARLEDGHHVGEQRPLPLVGQVMDGEPARDDVEPAELAERLAQVSGLHGHPHVVGEVRPGLLEHGRRVVDPDHRVDARTLVQHEPDQPSVAATQVEGTPRCGRKELGQRGFAGEPLRDGPDAPEVLVGLLVVGPAHPRAPRDELAEQHLAHLVARQRVDRLEAHRHLVRREVLAAERVERRGVDHRALARHDERPRHLTEAVVGDAGDRALGDVGREADHLGHLLGEDLEAAAVDHVRHPSLDPEEPFVVDAAEVAGAEPPVDEAAVHVVALGGRARRSSASAPGSRRRR